MTYPFVLGQKVPSSVSIKIYLSLTSKLPTSFWRYFSERDTRSTYQNYLTQDVAQPYIVSTMLILIHIRWQVPCPRRSGRCSSTRLSVLPATSSAEEYQSTLWSLNNSNAVPTGVTLSGYTICTNKHVYVNLYYNIHSGRTSLPMWGDIINKNAFIVESLSLLQYFSQQFLSLTIFIILG